GTRVSIYNARVLPKHPLLGLRFKNTTGEHLVQGPVSVVDGVYAGDARIADLQPGEERLLSYAIDLGTEVKPFDKVTAGPKMLLRPGKDGVLVDYTERHTRTYVIRNRSKQDRRLVIEHPIHAGWKLIEPKPQETTRDLYRFEVAVESGKEVRFSVAE